MRSTVDTIHLSGYLKRLSQNHLVAINRLEPYSNDKGAGTYIPFCFQ